MEIGFPAHGHRDAQPDRGTDGQRVGDGAMLLANERSQMLTSPIGFSRKNE